MSVCPAFEDRVLDYRELARDDREGVNEHLAGCAGCREFLQALEQVDAVFSSELRGMTLDSRQLADVRDRIAADVPVGRVTKLPEWLDFAAVCAVGVFGYALLTQTGLLAYLISTLSSPAN